MKVIIDGIEYVPKSPPIERGDWASFLHATRTGRKDSLDAMAAATGLSKAYLWQLEQRTSVEPSLSTIRALLAYAGATFEEFFG